MEYSSASTKESISRAVMRIAREELMMDYWPVQVETVDSLVMALAVFVWMILTVSRNT